MVEAADEALTKLAAPTKLRGYVQFVRASALAELNRDLDSADAIQESIRLLPDYSAPLLAASSIYAFLDRPAAGADYLIRAINVDPESARTVDDYDIGNLMGRLNAVHDEGRVRDLSDRLLQIGWLGKRLGSRSGLAAEAIQRHAHDGDLSAARALIPKLLVPRDSYSLLMQNDYRSLWPDIETWAGPKLGQQWTTYLSEARARWTANNDAEAANEYLTALTAARHYKTAVRDLLPLFDKPDRVNNYDLLFGVNALAEALAHLNRWKEGDSLFERAQAVWPIDSDANALNIAANYSVFLLREGRPDEALKRLDEGIAQAKKWTSQVGQRAFASMYQYRACMLHELGRDAEASVSMAIAVRQLSPSYVAELQLCLDNPQAAKKALIAGLEKEETRDGVIGFVQLPSEDPLPSDYARKMRARVNALKSDPELLQAVAKYGRVVPWPVNAGAPPETADK
jgi:tetratricopeptide (TPR) repeat protein